MVNGMLSSLAQANRAKPLGTRDMMKYQSHAVTAQRIEARDSPDDFPTPPRATRALIEYVIDNKPALTSMSCLEPACVSAVSAFETVGGFRVGRISGSS